MYNRHNHLGAYSHYSKMNSQSLTNNSQLSSPQPELLYGNGHFLVRLWSLLPGQSVRFNLTAEPSGNLQRSQFFLIDGSLNASGLNAPSALTTGRQVIMQVEDDPWTLQNPGNEVATLLEITQGEALANVPLPEVTEVRPWGSFTILKDEPHYKLKQLINTPGNRLSLQRHQKREEHWIAIAGHPEITLDDQTFHLQAGDYIHIPLHSWHRLANPTDSLNPQATETVEIIELQLGAYFGEDDIERCQDDYGRT
jgi:mannose-6-phosphate isomerase